MSVEQHHIAPSTFLRAATQEPTISPTHIALYLAIYTCWMEQNCVSPIAVPKSNIMQLSKISSNATYYRHLKDLNELGYIKYDPICHRYANSRIYLQTAEMRYFYKMIHK
jgi:hypothetical protein